MISRRYPYLGFVVALSLSMAPTFVAPEARAETDVHEVKIALFGDQGAGATARQVLALVKREKADLVLHLGDFDYRDSPKVFEKNIDAVLGRDFPYLAVIGNHDKEAWRGYQKFLRERAERIKEPKCTGNPGLRSACMFRGVFIALSAVGIVDHRGIGVKDVGSEKINKRYLRDQLAKTRAVWKICAWHKNHRLMQLGKKGQSRADTVSLRVYDVCREAGALIATGHNHSYSRTHVITRFHPMPKHLAPKEPDLTIAPGQTLAIVSGLGGQSPRPQTRHRDGWWASVYSKTQSATNGALFCIFHHRQRRDRARCYFKDINGRIVDAFGLRAAR